MSRKLKIGGGDDGYLKWDGHKASKGWECKFWADTETGNVTGNCANDNKKKAPQKKFSGQFDGKHLDITATQKDGQISRYFGTVEDGQFRGKIEIIKALRNAKRNVKGRTGEIGGTFFIEKELGAVVAKNVRIGGNGHNGYCQWKGSQKEPGWECKFRVELDGSVSGSCRNDEGSKTKKTFSGHYDGKTLNITATFGDGQVNRYTGKITNNNKFTGKVVIEKKGNNKIAKKGRKGVISGNVRSTLVRKVVKSKKKK